MNPVWVIGNGGHAKVVIDALKLGTGHSLAGILSDDTTSPSIEPNTKHVGPVTADTVRRAGVQAAIIAIGDNSARRRIATSLDEILKWISIVHPSAVVSPTATLGSGVLLCAGSIIQPCASVGNHAIVNTGCSIDHDSVIGAYAHIAPGTHLAGGVSVGEGAFLGVGVSVIPGITIGANAIVGAGSVVIRDVPGGARVAGVPARLLVE